jgi:hypothetical protein
MAMQNLALGLFALSNLVDQPDIVGGIIIFIAACIATFVGVVILGLWATTGYLRRIRA